MGKLKDQNAAAHRAEIAERIEGAWDVLRRMPDRERSALARAAAGQVWPMIVHSADEHAAWEKQPLRRPPPTSAQITMMEEVMVEWLPGLAKQDRKYLKTVWLMCGLKKSPTEVSKLLGCDRGTARIWRDAGLDRIARMRAVNSIDSKQLAEMLKQGMHHPQRAHG